MKAAVCYAFGQPLRVEDIHIDPPKAGEVKVRMVATAICHSDIHIVRGDWGGEVPVVAGHEGAGIVAETGANVDRVHAGDHVVVSLLRSCGRCEYCITGASHLCAGQFPLDHETRLHNQSGQPIRQGINTAAFAEYVVVDQSQVVPVPKDMRLESAALLACGVITGLGAVVNRARVPPGSSVVVVGAGGVGINSIQGARLAGAYPIIAVDLLDNKLETSLAFGATHLVNAAHENVEAAVSNITGGRMADYVFVTVGSVAAAEQAYALATRRGTIVFVGIPDWTTKVPIPLGPTITSEKTITGSLMGSTRLSLDVPRLIDLYRADRLKLDELISARYSLEQINEAIEATRNGAALRNMIMFE